MALDAATPRVIYTGTGAVSAYSVQDGDGNAIYFESNSHIKVSKLLISTGVVTALTEGVDYSLAGGPISGIVTLTAGNLPTTYKLAIWREQPLDQTTTFGTASDFSGATHTAVADRHRRVDQDANEKASRALKLDRFLIGYDAQGYALSNASYLEVTEGSAPGTPSSGLGRVYTKTDGKLYHLNDSATEVDLSGQATAAAASATAAATSATNASASATNSAASATSSAAQVALAAAQVTLATAQTTAATAQAVAAAGSATSAAANSESPSFTFKWSTNTAASDPGSTFVKGNNASIGSTTALYISETAVEGDVSGFLTSIFNYVGATSLASVILIKPTAKSNYLVLDVSAHVDSGTYRTLTATVAASNGSFSNNDTLICLLVRAVNLGSGVASFGSDNRTGAVVLTALDVASSVFANALSVASAVTCNVLGANATVVSVTGSTGPITSFGTGTNRLRIITFASTPTITHNATSLILPGGISRTMDAGDTLILVSDGSSNVRVIGGSTSVFLADQKFGPFTAIASATTTDLSTVGTIAVSVTGTVAITSFGAGASLLRIVQFAAALTLTHNATTLILPGAANITTAAGDVGTFLSDASGNWKCTGYTKADGRALVVASSTSFGSL